MARFEDFATSFATSLTDSWLQTAYQAGRLAEIRAAAEEERRTLREQAAQQRQTDTNRLMTAGEQEALLARIQGRQTRKNTRTAGAEQRQTDTNRLVTAGDQETRLARVQGRQKRLTEAERQEQERLTAQFLDQLPTSAAQREQMAAQAALAMAQAERTGADAASIRAALEAGAGGVQGNGLMEQMIAGVDPNELLLNLLDHYSQNPQMQTIEDERGKKRTVPVAPMESAMGDLTQMYMGMQAVAGELVNAGRGADQAEAESAMAQEQAAAAAAQEQAVQSADPVDGRQYLFGDPATDPIAAAQQTSLLQQAIAQQTEDERQRRINSFRDLYYAYAAGQPQVYGRARPPSLKGLPGGPASREIGPQMVAPASVPSANTEADLLSSATQYMRDLEAARTRSRDLRQVRPSLMDAMASQRSPFLR